VAFLLFLIVGDERLHVLLDIRCSLPIHRVEIGQLPLDYAEGRSVRFPGCPKLAGNASVLRLGRAGIRG
jgi:hypothetical protein